MPIHHAFAAGHESVTLRAPLPKPRVHLPHIVGIATQVGGSGAAAVHEVEQEDRNGRTNGRIDLLNFTDHNDHIRRQLQPPFERPTSGEDEEVGGSSRGSELHHDHHALSLADREPPRLHSSHHLSIPSHRASHPHTPQLVHRSLEGTSALDTLSPTRLPQNELPEAQSCSLRWSGPNGRADADAADDAAAAALLGIASQEATQDPLLIEKKIRAVQKKLRRVQTIEELGAGTHLDSGQQVLLASKPRLQAYLTQLLQQWALLEPALLEKQERQLLAIADSECAICLEEYSTETPGIRTSCCGYHFHRECLKHCIDSTGHCPICSTPKGSCKVVQQRSRS